MKITPQVANPGDAIDHPSQRERTRPDLAAFHKLTGNATLIALTGVLGDLLRMGRASGVPPSQVLQLFEVWKLGGALGFLGERVANAGSGAPSFHLQMARKVVRLMIETAGREQLTVLPAVAAAMDRALQQGHATADFAVFAQPR